MIYIHKILSIIVFQHIAVGAKNLIFALIPIGYYVSEKFFRTGPGFIAQLSFYCAIIINVINLERSLVSRISAFFTKSTKLVKYFAPKIEQHWVALGFKSGGVIPAIFFHVLPYLFAMLYIITLSIGLDHFNDIWPFLIFPFLLQKLFSVFSVVIFTALLVVIHDRVIGHFNIIRI